MKALVLKPEDYTTVFVHAIDYHAKEHSNPWKKASELHVRANVYLLFRLMSYLRSCFGCVTCCSVMNIPLTELAYVTGKMILSVSSLLSNWTDPVSGSIGVHMHRAKIGKSLQILTTA